MTSRKTSLLILVFISTVLIGSSLAAPTTATEASAQMMPLPTAGFTQLQNGVWYRVDNSIVPNPLPNATGSAVNGRVFFYDFPSLDGTHQALYGVRETTDWGLNSTGKAYYHKVTLISDPDGSLSGTSHRMSGDEIVVTTTGILLNGTYQTRSQKTYAWYNVTGTTANPTFTQLSNTGLTNLRNKLLSDIVANTLANGSLATSLYLLWGVSLLNNETSPTLESQNYAYFTWWIDQDFFPHFLKTATFTDIDIMQIRHRLLGFVAFNDTNRNGIMDMKYRVVQGPTGPYRTLVSSEAMYVFKPNFVHTVAGSNPTYNSVTGYVDWDMTMTGVNGTLVSLRPLVSSINTVIDQVGFYFHFKRTANDAVVKVDEHLGTFSGVAGVSQYSYLSLAIAYFSYFESLSIGRYHPAVNAVGGGAVDTEANSTAIVNKIDLNATSGFAQIQVAGDNYIWGKDGLSYPAYGNIIPWFFFSAQFTTVGDYSVTGFSFGKLMYYYEACFPEWGGYSITHDPYFAVFGSSSPGEGTSPIMFIVAGAGIGVLAAAVVLLVRRRKVAETGIVKTV